VLLRPTRAKRVLLQQQDAALHVEIALACSSAALAQALHARALRQPE
jgi:hypothetical protein